MSPTERQARRLIADNAEAEPALVKAYWFPHDEEVRVVEVMSDLPYSEDEVGTAVVAPFYFRGSDSEPGYQLPMAVALLHPAEFDQRPPLPDSWGTWADAKQIEILTPAI